MPSKPSRKGRRSNKKWSPVLVNFQSDLLLPATSAGQGNVFNYVGTVLTSNSSNTQAAPTATVIKAGNFKVWIDLQTNTAISATYSLRAYVMFVPQGYTIDANTPTSHPEWILCWRGIEATSGLQAVSMQSKLKRNLNSGDGIVLLIVAQHGYIAQDSSLPIAGSCSYVCCAN